MPSRTVGSALLALLAAASPSAAEDPAAAGATPSSWRLLVGPSLFLPSFGTTYASTYSPLFRSVAHTSTATQTMPLDAGEGLGVWLGLERDLGAHVGLQLSAHYGEADLSGVPGHYDLTMRYTSRPPPSYEPVEVTVRRSEARLAASGRLKTLAVALDLVAWTDLGSRGRLGLSVGPAWVHAKGRAESLVYTEYRMGGHSTAFSQDVLVSFDFPADALGLDLRGFAEVALGRHAGLRLEAGYCLAPETQAEATVLEVVDPEDVAWSVDRAEVQQVLSPAPVPFEASFFRASVAVALRF
jgi:hypothetical protein